MVQLAISPYKENKEKNMYCNFPFSNMGEGLTIKIMCKQNSPDQTVQSNLVQLLMKKVNKQCLLDTPRTVRVSEKTWQVIVRTRRP